MKEIIYNENNLRDEEIKEWVKKGAKPTDTAKALIEKAGIDLKEV